ncbi:M48 family metallopeptidase [Tropicibacter naphthalenivorans]|uniref:TPR repeat-containing protein YfgC n=1 Tax=Tropicibacter naphthalenivorans TaxID=441103 RepID=A0A0P1FZQ1_9RHOB|nr:M48 family metallopeptidase [Tropicibacter naphthalenivorans]CUH74688.1 TPR repeat-containing protein YfgC precursor [Tropicibacter naphthalenivorans]SMC49830.1 Peptidase family M48 [Tropicibacter naphthalenivorans]
MRRLAPLLFLLASACTVETMDQPELSVSAPVGPPPSSVRAARMFIEVVETVEPVAERECRQRTRGMNCDFNIVVDDRPGQPPNAFQTEDRFGRPVLAFNIALINEVHNADELAFVMGHEAAHHIQDHLAKTRLNATLGAVVLSGTAAILGATPQEIEAARDAGSVAGARSFSKDFELEADKLGTIIAARAGYDPLRGALYFNRLPDPGNRFLGSHPPNASRLQVVKDTVAGM